MTYSDFLDKRFDCLGLDSAWWLKRFFFLCNI